MVMMNESVCIRVAGWLKAFSMVMPLSIFAISLLALDSTDTRGVALIVLLASTVLFLVLMLYAFKAKIELKDDHVLINDGGLLSRDRVVSRRDIKSVDLGDSAVPKVLIHLVNGEILIAPETGHHSETVMEIIESWLVMHR